MSDRYLSFFVEGTPRPQGSMKAITSASTGKPFVKQSAPLIEWRNMIITAARQTMGMTECAEWEPYLSGPVRLSCTFVFARPKSHTKKRIVEDRGVKDNGPDLDKLVRAVGDALTLAGVWHDDRQVATITAEKVYLGEVTRWAFLRPGVLIRVDSMKETP